MDHTGAISQQLSHTFFQRVFGYWLSGFAKSSERFQRLTAAELRVVDQVLARWRPTIAPEKVQGVDELCIKIQAINVASRRSPEDPIGWLNNLISSNGDSAVRTTQDALQGLLFANLPRAATIWSQLPKEFRKLILDVADLKRISGGPSGSQVEHVSWCDTTREKLTAGDAEEQLRAYAALTKAQREDFAALMLQLHPVFEEDHDLRYYVADELARLSSFSGALEDATLERAHALGIAHPRGIFRRNGRRVRRVKKGQWTEQWEDSDDALEDGFRWREGKKPRKLYHDEGFILVENADEHAATQSFACAPANTTFRDPLGPMLAVLLELDLTRPELAFLGIEGTYLRICTWAGSFGKTCFTEVDGYGAASLHDSMEEEISSAPEAAAPNRCVQLIGGRAIYSPFEGCVHAGYLGNNTRIGGLPNWEQYPEFPICPESGKRMTFIAQMRDLTGGTAYVFINPRTMVVAVRNQID